MKQILIITSLVSLVGAVIGMSAGAQTADVTATVTIGAVSVTVDTASFDYGSMPYNTSKESFDVVPNNIKATVGGVITDLDIKGAVTTDWITLAGTAGINTYVHAFATSTAVGIRPGSGDYSALTTSNVPLAVDVPISGERFFGLKITTPTSGVGTQQSAVVTLTASFGG